MSGGSRFTPGTGLVNAVRGIGSIPGAREELEHRCMR